MSDRPWDDVEMVKSLMGRSRVLAHPTDSAAGTTDATVEFDVDDDRPWEDDERMIRSSVALDSDGVYEMSVRLPETDLSGNSFKNQQMLQDALAAAIDHSSFPQVGFGQVRGGANGWNPHAVWSGKPRTRYYEYDDREEHRINPRQSVRQIEAVVKNYRREVEARK